MTEQRTDNLVGACEVVAGPQPPDWSEFLAGRAEASVYHDPRWGQVMLRAYGNRPTYLTALRGGRVVGVLQLVRQKSLLFGTHLCSLPYFDACGILAEDDEASDGLLSAARDALAGAKARWCELRQTSALPGEMPTRTDKVTLELPLPDDPDVLWKQLDAKVRNQVRKPQKADCEAVEGGAELLGEFHAIYVRTMRDLGSPPHSLRFFREIFDAFDQDARIHVVRKDGQSLAASLVLIDAGATHVPWAGSDWRRRELNANMLLYWEMLAAACRRGSRAFDFGRSTRDEGTYRFKRQWGAQEVPLFWHYLLAEGAVPPDLRPESGRYGRIVAAWKRLPIPLARTLGPRLISKLS